MDRKTDNAWDNYIGKQGEISIQASIRWKGQIKDGAYYCYCAYVLRISRYSDFLLLVLINTGIFLRGLKLCGESRT